jgi:serine/threonine protein kinase
MQDSKAGSLTGRSLGDYLLRGILGVGGMAEVYQAKDQKLEREVAVKVLSTTLAADADYVRRFHDEAKQVAALRHPHIVPIYGFGEELGYFYHVMPLLHSSLRDRLRLDGHLPPDEAVRMVCEVASALGAAHAVGLVHRDVKPENILLDGEGNALLADFGIARDMAALGQAGVVWTLARTGLPVGTPQYMAPEQIRAEPCDQRADIYSLGAVLYELLTGKAPHEASSPFEAAALVLSAPIVPPSQRNPQVWPALEQVVDKALAFDPANRYSDMQSFSAALELALALPRTAAPVPSAVDADERRMMGLLPLVEILPTRLQQPRMLAALALALIVAVLGASFLVLHAAGNGAPSASGDGLPAALTTATATAPMVPTTTTTTPQPTTTTTTPQPTITSTTPSPSPTPVPSPSPTPTPTLMIQPMPLVLQPSSQNPNMCVATQTITNTTGQTVGWQWQQPQEGGFHFQVNGGPMMGWPKDLQPGIAPHSTDTLTATSNCQAQPQNFGILLTDTPGDQYTFVLRLQ